MTNQLVQQQINTLSQEEQQLLLTLLLQKAGLTISENIDKFIPQVQEIQQTIPVIELPKKLTKEERQEIRFTELMDTNQFRTNGGKAITLSFTEVCLLLTKLQGYKLNVYGSKEYKMNFDKYATRNSKKDYYPSLMLIEDNYKELPDYSINKLLHIDSNQFVKINYHVTKDSEYTNLTIHFIDKNSKLIEVTVIIK